MKMFLKANSGTLFLIMAVFCVGVLTVEAAVDPVVVEVHYQNGVKFYKRGLYDKAAQEFEKTLSLDPGNQEAKEYLEKTKAMQENKQEAGAKGDRNAEIKLLSEQGKQLYLKHDYQAALEVFNKILTLKHVDDFASFYKERCEIMISQQMARQKKIEDRQKLKEKKVQERLAQQEEKEQKKLQREEMLKKRAEISEEHKKAQESPSEEKKEGARNLREEKIAAAKEKKEKALEEKNARLEAKQARQDERRKAKEEKIAAAKERKAEKIKQAQEERDARKQRKEELTTEKRGKIEEKKETQKKAKREKAMNAETKKVAAKQAAEEKKANRELFMKGVEQYGRKQFEDAIASFNALIDAEIRANKKVYTGSAERMRDKAKKRLKDIEKKELESNPTLGR